MFQSVFELLEGNIQPLPKLRFAVAHPLRFPRSQYIVGISRMGGLTRFYINPPLGTADAGV